MRMECSSGSNDRYYLVVSGLLKNPTVARQCQTHSSHPLPLTASSSSVVILWPLVKYPTAFVSTHESVKALLAVHTCGDLCVDFNS